MSAAASIEVWGDTALKFDIWLILRGHPLSYRWGDGDTTPYTPNIQMQMVRTCGWNSGCTIRHIIKSINGNLICGSVVSCFRWSRHSMAMELIPYGSIAFWTLPLLWVGSAKPTPRTEFSKCHSRISMCQCWFSYAFLHFVMKLNWLNWFS